jgi:hypothetical protein
MLSRRQRSIDIGRPAVEPRLRCDLFEPSVIAPQQQQFGKKARAVWERKAAFVPESQQCRQMLCRDQRAGCAADDDAQPTLRALH